MLEVEVLAAESEKSIEVPQVIDREWHLLMSYKPNTGGQHLATFGLSAPGKNHIFS